MDYLKINMRKLIVCLLIGVVLLLPLAIRNNYLLGVLIIIGLYTLIVQGLGILMGYGGQVSFGHAAFYGLGSYTVAILTTHYLCPPLLTLAGAALVPAVIAALIGKPVLRLRELYLALATLGFGILVHIAFTEGQELTGGPSGLSGIPNLSVGPLVFDTDLKFFYLVCTILILVLASVYNLVNSRTGRALRAIRESEYAAENAGIDTARLKLQAFVFSALLAGLAGGLYAFYITFISPSPFTFHASVQFVLMAVIGGLGTFWGPLVGTTVVVALGEFLRWVVPLVIPGAGGEYEIIFYGLLLVILMILRPEGLSSLAAGLGRREQNASGSAGNQ